MLKRLEKQEFEQYVDFAYVLALDVTKSGYPTYADGIKTKQDFIVRAREAFSNANEEILLFVREGKISGWIHYFYIPESRYLDTCAFCIAEGMQEALAEFISFARERFPGSELYLGFPKENAEAVAALDAWGFARIEESYNGVLDFNDYTLRPVREEVVPITRERFGLFSVLHAQNEADMYWTCARILTDIDRWRIYVCLRNGKAAGAIYFMESEAMSEIFGVDFPNGVYDSEVFRALLTAALNDGKRKGIGHMVFFHAEASQADALVCGFRCVGGYICFKTVL